MPPVQEKYYQVALVPTLILESFMIKCLEYLTQYLGMPAFCKLQFESQYNFRREKAEAKEVTSFKLQMQGISSFIKSGE